MKDMAIKSSNVESRDNKRDYNKQHFIKDII